MKLKLTLLLLFLAIAGSLSAQADFMLPREGFFPGTLHYKGGKVRDVFVSAPKKANQGSIIIRATKTAKKEKVPSAMLDSISINPRKGVTHYFEHLPWCYKKGGKPKKAMWLYVTVKGYATLYLWYTTFILDRNGYATSVQYTTQGSGTVDTYMLRKKNEKTAFYFAHIPCGGIAIGFNAALKRAASQYLYEDKDLVDKINKKLLKTEDLEEIITIYNDYMSKEK
jgi:hypothetical protein